MVDKVAGLIAGIKKSLILEVITKLNFLEVKIKLNGMGVVEQQLGEKPPRTSTCS